MSLSWSLRDFEGRDEAPRVVRGVFAFSWFVSFFILYSGRETFCSGWVRIAFSWFVSLFISYSSRALRSVGLSCSFFHTPREKLCLQFYISLYLGEKSSCSVSLSRSLFHTPIEEPCVYWDIYLSLSLIFRVRKPCVQLIYLTLYSIVQSWKQLIISANISYSDWKKIICWVILSLYLSNSEWENFYVQLITTLFIPYANRENLCSVDHFALYFILQS